MHTHGLNESKSIRVFSPSFILNDTGICHRENIFKDLGKNMVSKPFLIYRNLLNNPYLICCKN
jgi:hypothetical protein